MNKTFNCWKIINVILSKTKTISKFSELMNVFIVSDFHIMQHLIRTYGTTSTVLHVCIDFVFSLSFNSLLLDAWFSQIILTWSFPYLEMSVVFRRYSINANTTIDITIAISRAFPTGSGKHLECIYITRC